MDILQKVEPFELYTAGDVVPEQIANTAFDKLLSLFKQEDYHFVNQYQLEQSLRLVATWYGFTTKNDGHAIRCGCSKSYKVRNADKKKLAADSTNFMFDPSQADSKKKRNITKISSLDCPFLVHCSPIGPSCEKDKREGEKIVSVYVFFLVFVTFYSFCSFS